MPYLVETVSGGFLSLTTVSKIEFESMDLDGTWTIRNYLKELLCRLWDEKDEFSGKRPFGNSSWEFDLYKALIDAKIIAGVLDEYGYIESMDDEDQAKADKLILDIIVEIM